MLLRSGQLSAKKAIGSCFPPRLMLPQIHRYIFQQRGADRIIWHMQQLARRKDAKNHCFIWFFIYIIIIMVNLRSRPYEQCTGFLLV